MSSDDIRLKKESEQLHLILSLMAEGLIVVHSGGAIALVNQAAGVLSRKAPDEAIGELFEDIFPIVEDTGSGEVQQHPTLRAIEEETVIRVHVTDNWYVKQPDGSRFPVGMTVTPFRSEGQKYAIVLIRDITHEKDIDRAKTEFVSLASHQLKTPLSSINWFTEMLLAGDAGRLKAKQREYLTEVAQSSKRMTALVNELLNVSRLELGTFIIQPELTDLAALADNVVHELMPKITKKKQTLTKHYQEELPKIRVDLTLTRMIFQNLLSNAVKYTPEGGSIDLSIATDERNIIITIADTGLGIPQKQQENVFVKFFRADNALASEQEGTGLGLYIIKAIIVESGGTIDFVSKENEGTTFTVTIPLSGMLMKKGSRSIS